MTNIYDFTVQDASGEDVALKDYEGKLLLVVNVASKCGLTPQYEGLEKLYEATKDQGLEILGFPSNQFLGQEPGTNEEIQEFCSTTYGVTFPVLAKVDVNGEDAEPLFKWMRSEAPAGNDPGTEEFLERVKSLTGSDEPDSVKWNFNKFLVSRDGAVIKRYEPPVTPDYIADDLKNYL
jgi:glutathione peroxidase